MPSLPLCRFRSAALLGLALSATTAVPIAISAPAMAGNSNQGGLAATSSRTNAPNYIVQVSTGNDQATTNSSSTQAVGSNSTTQTPDYRVPQGTVINVKYNVSDKVVIAPGDTKSLTLTVAQDIYNSKGKILIPKDSQIQGQIVPRYNGSSFLGAQFIAQTLIIGNQSYNGLNATSVLLKTQQSTGGSGVLGGLQRTVGNTAINAAAQVLLGRVTGQGGSLGDILGQGGNVGDILGQAGNVGDILGNVLNNRGSNQQQDSQISINPQKDLQLTVGSDFYVSTISTAPSYSVKTY